jgi:hypothetical protein
MIDIALVKHLLNVLDLYDAPRPEDVIGAEVELRASRPLTTSNVRSHIRWAVDRGWVSHRIDEFQRDIYAITPTGKTKKDEM